MRLLTNDEMIAVSGGSITGYDNPNCLDKNANPYNPQAMTEAGPGGWKIVPGTTKITVNGIERTGRGIECNTETDQDDDSEQESENCLGTDTGSEEGDGGDD